MNHLILHKQFLGSLLAFALLGWTTSSNSQVIMRESDVSKENLIDALTPERKDPRTRSIRVEPSKAETQNHERQAAASLLITFETNSAQLTASARTALDSLGAALNSDQLASYNFAVEGHADPRGTAEHNLVLSRARARSVAEYLYKQHGIEKGRLDPIGKGDKELANAADPTAAVNRRVTIKTITQ